MDLSIVSEHKIVFCGDWGRAPTSMKQEIFARVEISCFRKVGTALHCLPVSRLNPTGHKDLHKMVLSVVRLMDYA